MKQCTRAVAMTVALLLSVLVVLALVACGGEQAPAESVTESETIPPAASESESETEAITETESTDATESETLIETVPETVPETIPETIPETAPETEPLPVFTDKTMKIVVISQVGTIHSEPVINNENAITWPTEQTILDVTGESEEWYRITLDGKEGYIKKNIVGDAAVLDTFTEVNEQIVITGSEKINLRSYPATDSDLSIRAFLDKDTVLTRIGVSETWSRVLYTMIAETNGEEVETVREYYVHNDYVTLYEKTPDGTLPFVPTRPETIQGDWKAIWLSQFDLQSIYTNGSAQRDEAGFRKLMTKVLDNVVKDGFNTVILQVRPNADSHYPSEVYPPSSYAVGSYANDFTYDPIAIITEMCRERKLSVHGWINPMRGMTEAQLQQVDDKYLIKQWYNDSTKKGTYITFVNKNWYLNPAYPEVRQMICDGAAEILEKYDMDGIHMDDYFYPTTDASFDAKAYNEYKKNGGTLDVLSWRRTNLDALVSELYATVKTHDLRDLFGISPAGNINTVYDSHCADVYNWCANPGYIDYIMPQVYFGFEHASWDFVKTSNLWSDAIQTDYVSLMIGVSFGKALSGVDNYAGTGKNEWSEHKDILKRGLEYSATMDKCVGMTVFCYQYLYDPIEGTTIYATKKEHEAFVATLKTITWHKDEE